MTVVVDWVLKTAFVFMGFLKQRSLIQTQVAYFHHPEEICMSLSNSSWKIRYSFVQVQIKDTNFFFFFAKK